MTEAAVELLAAIDAADVVKGLRNNDEAILAFITEMLKEAGSSELTSRLVERLSSDDWEEKV